MSINKSAINTSAINDAAGFEPIVASGTLVQIEQSVGEVASGSLANFEQEVGIVASGNLVEIEQIVKLTVKGSGTLVNIEQSQVTVASGSLVQFEQYVVTDASSPTTWFERNGWDAIIKIGGQEIDKTYIHGSIVIERKEGASALADFSIIPDSGTIDINEYSGKNVTIDVITESGVDRIFTGIVDIPKIDVIDKKITFRCSDRRLEKINSTLSSVVPTIGFYSDQVFTSNDDDLATQLENRLTTVPYTLDFDAFGNYHVTSILAKATPDFTLSNSQVFRKTPEIDLLSRARIVNSVKVEYKYRYQRLYHWTRNFSWRSQIADNFCLFLQQSYQLTSKVMVLESIQAAGWPVKGTISFTDTPPGGWYCGGIGWMASSATGTFVQSTDANGNLITDSDGNPVYTQSTTSGTQNLSSVFCTAATWKAGTRWSQVIEEVYSFDITSPQSIAQYGVVEGYVGTEFETSIETDNWENYKSYDDRGLGENFTIDEDTDRNQFYNIQATVINIAKTKIIKSHRDTRVKFFRRIWPNLDLRHTVRLNTSHIVAQGKVMSIKHTLNVLDGSDETEVTLALCKSQGSASNTTPSYIGKPSDATFFPDSSTINFYSRYGQDPETTTGGEAWTGYIGNITAGFNSTYFTSRFIVDTPSIPNEYRNLRTLTGASGTYNIQLPNDDLQITF